MFTILGGYHIYFVIFLFSLIIIGYTTAFYVVDETVAWTRPNQRARIARRNQRSERTFASPAVQVYKLEFLSFIRQHTGTANQLLQRKLKEKMHPPLQRLQVQSSQVNLTGHSGQGKAGSGRRQTSQRKTRAGGPMGRHLTSKQVIGVRFPGIPLKLKWGDGY